MKYILLLITLSMNTSVHAGLCNWDYDVNRYGKCIAAIIINGGAYMPLHEKYNNHIRIIGSKYENSNAPDALLLQSYLHAYAYSSKFRDLSEDQKEDMYFDCWIRVPK